MAPIARGAPAPLDGHFLETSDLLLLRGVFPRARAGPQRTARARRHLRGLLPQVLRVIAQRFLLPLLGGKEPVIHEIEVDHKYDPEEQGDSSHYTTRPSDSSAQSEFVVELEEEGDAEMTDDEEGFVESAEC